jgi:hypothetical protein
MKRKSIIVIALLIVVAVFVYIGISSTIINENYYRNLAWKMSNHDKAIINWETANVSKINLKETYIYTPLLFSCKLNRFLLFLNGGSAVRVEFRTTQDGYLGPIVTYFNPFTKQYIGSNLRF